MDRFGKAEFRETETKRKVVKTNVFGDVGLKGSCDITKIPMIRPDGTVYDWINSITCTVDVTVDGEKFSLHEYSQFDESRHKFNVNAINEFTERMFKNLSSKINDKAVIEMLKKKLDYALDEIMRELSSEEIQV